LSLVLVDHRGPFAVVAHPGHQVPEPRAASGREMVTRVPKIMEMQARQADQGGAANAAPGPPSAPPLSLGRPARRTPGHTAGRAADQHTLLRTQAGNAKRSSRGSDRTRRNGSLGGCGLDGVASIRRDERPAETYGSATY